MGVHLDVDAVEQLEFVLYDVHMISPNLGSDVDMSIKEFVEPTLGSEQPVTTVTTVQFLPSPEIWTRSV